MLCFKNSSEAGVIICSYCCPLALRVIFMFCSSCAPFEPCMPKQNGEVWLVLLKLAEVTRLVKKLPSVCDIALLLVSPELFSKFHRELLE